MCVGPEIMLAAQVAGLAIGAGGAATSAYYQGQASDASKKAEEFRKGQMELEGQRKRREIMRQTQLAKSQALTRTTGQTGSAATSSSALEGAYAQEDAFATKNIGQLDASLDAGRGIFDANAAQADARTGQSIGQGMQTIGGALIDRSKDISQIGISLFGETTPGGPYDPWNTAVRRRGYLL